MDVAAERQTLARQLQVNARLQVTLRKQMRQELMRRYVAAREGYADRGILGAEAALIGHEHAVDALIRAQLRRVAEIFGPLVIEALKGRGAWLKKDYEDDYYQQMVEAWLRDGSTYKIAADIAYTTRHSIRNIITMGLAEGLGTIAIARQLRQQLGGALAGVRAHIIARTETHGASSFASDAAARATGIAGLQRAWLAVGDQRTRPAHAGADGQVVGMDEPFQFVTEKGETYVLMRPLDPAGPAAGVIMCRCAVAYRVPE